MITFSCLSESRARITMLRKVRDAECVVTAHFNEHLTQVYADLFGVCVLSSWLYCVFFTWKSLWRKQNSLIFIAVSADNGFLR